MPPATNVDSRGGRWRVALLIGMSAALAGSVAWNIYGVRGPRIKPTQMKSTDFLATWRCLACQHEQNDRAGPGPRTCPQCGESAFYASLRYRCARDGEFWVAFNYDDQGKPSFVKVANESWEPYLDLRQMRSGLRCPACGASLVAAQPPRLPVGSSDRETSATPRPGRRSGS